MRVIYQTAVANINVAIGSTKELTSSLIQSTETVDYLLGGALTLRNGRIDKYQFEEGYCQASAAGSVDYFDSYYYDHDHLGNVRQVIEPYGTNKSYVIQKMEYYPFGAEFCDGGTKNFVQNHKYNGKEFDHMHGLNTYDYGARQYNPVTGRWDRMDPLCEDYYPYSPYNYCMDNPVKNIDPDGRFPLIPMIVGAVTGAGTEYTLEVTENLLDGKGWNSFTDVDGTKIGMSAAAGACGMGLGKAKSVCKVGAKVLSMASDAVFGAFDEVYDTHKNNENITVATCAKGIAKGVGFNVASSKLSKLIPDNKTQKVLDKKASDLSKVSRRPKIPNKEQSKKNCKKSQERSKRT